MKRTLILALPALALLGGCSSEKSQQKAAAAAPTFHEVMKNEVDAHADALWEISNPAIGDKAGIDPAKMTDERWNQLAQEATAVQEAALQIAAMDPIVVVRPGVKLSDEGVPGGHDGAEVQRAIDKDPQKLRDLATSLANHVGDIAAAAKAHDAVKAGPLIDQLDGVCESCHLEFWYPSQKALVEQYIRENK